MPVRRDGNRSPLSMSRRNLAHPFSRLDGCRRLLSYVVATNVQAVVASWGNAKHPTHPTPTAGNLLNQDPWACRGPSDAASCPRTSGGRTSPGKLRCPGRHGVGGCKRYGRCGRPRYAATVNSGPLRDSLTGIPSVAAKPCSCAPSSSLRFRFEQPPVGVRTRSKAELRARAERRQVGLET